MRFAARRRPDAAERTALLGLARGGDEAALAALRLDLDPAALGVLADEVGTAPSAHAALSAARAQAATPDGLARLVPLLLDGAGRSPALVAEVLGVGSEDVRQAREQALAGAGLLAAPPGCRGWLLVSRPETLTAAEQRAGDAHLAGCRHCTAARAACAQAVRRTGTRAAAGAAPNP